MEFNFAYKSVKKAILNSFEQEFANEVLAVDNKARFGINDKNEIAAILFSAPPTYSLARQLTELPSLVSLAVIPVLYSEDPMLVYSEGCLDPLIESASQIKIGLFATNKIPISTGNIDSLANNKSIEYLRFVSNIFDFHVDSLKKFDSLASMTLADCAGLTCERIASLLSVSRISELYLLSGQYSPEEIARLKTSAPSTTFRLLEH